MKSLITVQKWAKAFKIIATVVLIICLVAVAMSLLGMIFGDAVMGTIATVGNVNIKGIAELEDFDMENLTLYFLCAVIELGAVCAILITAIVYLKKELASGTPFTYEFAKNTRTLAILTLALPIAADLLTSLILGAGEGMSTEIDVFAALALFAASAVFKHGADIMNMGSAEPEA